MGSHVSTLFRGAWTGPPTFPLQWLGLLRLQSAHPRLSLLHAAPASYGKGAKPKLGLAKENRFNHVRRHLFLWPFMRNRLDLLQSNFNCSNAFVKRSWAQQAFPSLLYFLKGVCDLRHQRGERWVGQILAINMDCKYSSLEFKSARPSNKQATCSFATIPGVVIMSSNETASSKNT